MARETLHFTTKAKDGHVVKLQAVSVEAAERHAKAAGLTDLKEVPKKKGGK